MSKLPEFGLKDEYREDYFPQTRIRAKKGPSSWEQVKDDRKAYGKHFDFRILDENVFMPCSEAAQEWLYAHFSCDSTFYTLAPDDGVCYTGVVVDRGLDVVLERAARAGLISEEFALNALDEQMRQEGRE